MATDAKISPKTIGDRYQVERLLGQGGMGRVWLARDAILGRRVAIKVLRDDLSIPPSVRAELVTRMQHEAQAAAAVSHPNIVTLHDMGEDPSLGLYLVFEYVAGPRTDGPESLRDRLRDGPMPLADVARLARELGGALTFAHGAGVVHRDVKPENVLASRTGAKIADFGIARIPESTLTRANTVLGTPAYTAPEALNDGTFGPASDQFALAATLYEAVTGRRAFGDADPIVTAGKVSSEPPPPLEPVVGSPTQVRTLGAALSKGLAKEPGARFGSCADLGEAIARAIERPETTDSQEVALPFDNPEDRPPLSSRLAAAERVRGDRALLTPSGEITTRPSVILRRKTRRFQNYVAAGALLVIIGLVLFGRKPRPTVDAPELVHDRDAAAPSTTEAPRAPSTAKPARSARPLIQPTVERSGANAATSATAGTAAPPVLDDAGTSADDPAEHHAP